MSTPVPLPVIALIPAGEDGSAVRYAAREAVRRRTALRLVHAFPRDDPERRQVAGAQQLQAAVEMAREVTGPELDVTGVLVQGPQVEAALAASTDAALVVVEHRDVIRLIQALTRPRRGAPAGYPRMPIVCVPANWSPDEHRPRPVTVCVQTPADCATTIRQALDVLGSTGTSLRVLHAWSLPRVDEVVQQRVGPAWEEQVRAEIEAALTWCYGATAPIPLEVDVRHETPAAAVVAASRTSDLIVLNRHDPRAPGGSHLGRVARSALYDAACPVMLLPGAHRTVMVAAARGGVHGPEERALRR
jgi:nucleotide-binding universal stress UspA family protein